MSQIWNQFTGYFTSALEALADFYSFAGGHRWALAIITLTLIVRTLLLPVAIKQIKSMREQQRLQPEVARLRQKYGRDRQKMTQEMMELYRREGVNPYAACLPMIAQMPVFFAMYQVLRHLTDIPKEAVKRLTPIAKESGVTVIALAQKEGLVPTMPFLGLGDLTQPASKSVAGWLLLAIMTGTQFISTRQLNPGGTQQQQRMQQLLPFFFVIIMINFPAALVLYWCTQNIYQFVQQMIMLRGLDVRHWFKKEAPERKLRGKDRPKPMITAPAPTPAPEPVEVAAVRVSETFGSPLAEGFGAPVVRRDLSDKRKRRRRRKKKRR